VEATPLVRFIHKRGYGRASMSCRSAVSWFAQAVRRYRLGLGGGGDEDYAQSGFTCGISHSILELSPLLCVNTCIGAVEPMHALAP
jgi:hypothetical protein